MAIWSQNKWIIVPLIMLILGHWSLILQGAQIASGLRHIVELVIGAHLFTTWIPGQGCVITNTKTNVLIAQFIYSMVLDFIVLLLSAWKLLLPRTYSSRLVNVLFRDGLAFFMVAYVSCSELSVSELIFSLRVYRFLGNLLVVVFELLDLNPVMNAMFNTPSVVISTVSFRSRFSLLYHRLESISTDRGNQSRPQSSKPSGATWRGTVSVSEA